MNKEIQHPNGSAKVRLVSKYVIECVLDGSVTGAIVKQSVDETEVLANDIIAKGGKPRLLIDMTQLVAQDSGARSEAKRLARMGFERVAICGARGALAMIGQYIVQITGMQFYTKFFRTRLQGDRWINAPIQTKPRSRGLSLKLAALLVGVIGIGALVGWTQQNEWLVAFFPGFKPMNPVIAVGFILAAISMLVLFGVKKTTLWRLPFIYLVALCLCIYGMVILTGHLFTFSTGIDEWLFADRLGVFSSIDAGVSPGDAFLLVFLAASLYLVGTELKRTWQLYAYRVVGLLALLTLVVALTGYLFDVKSFFGIVSLPVPIGSLLAFLIALPALVASIYTVNFFPVFRNIVRLYWAGGVVFALIIILTAVIWRQTASNIAVTNDLQAQRTFEKTINTIDGRVDAYINALHGYKAFFESSHDVSAVEFASYYRVSNVAISYPGLSTISLVRLVPHGDIPRFQEELRSQALESPQYKNFKVLTPTRATHYVLTYSQPAENASVTLGTDLSPFAGQSSTFEAARDTGEPRASGIIAFESPDGGNESGFLISIPVYVPGADISTETARHNAILGFVNTTFRNDVIFRDIFKEINLEGGVVVRIAASNGTFIYNADTTRAAIDSNNPKFKGTLNVAGKRWNIEMQTDSTYGLTGVANTASTATLVGGVGLAMLAAFLVVSLARRRQQALMLASTMTEDLNNERNKAEAIRQKDEAILASIGDAVFAIDPSGVITLFNPAAAKISGYQEHEALGMPYRDILPFIMEKTGKPDTHFIERALAGRPASMKGDVALRRKDGKMIAVADSASPIRDSTGEIIGAIVIFRDVSKERELDRAKSEFVSLASHQLRTPLSAINWYSEMILSGDAGKLTKDQTEYMSEIYEGNKRMVELVDSLLNVSRIEVGRLKNEPQDVSMTDLADSLEKELRTSITTKHLKYDKATAKHLPTIYADPKLLRMIVQNLLSNAVKYTPPKGSVALTMRLAKPDDLAKTKLRHNQQYMLISVADTGYGIPKSQQDKIFGKLFRADNVRKMEVEGTGLGLYIIKEVAEKIGGAIWFNSVEGKGATFYVIIPIKTRSF